MTISVVGNDVIQNIEGAIITRATLTINGLTPAAANTIPHGLGRTPYRVPNYQATSGIPGFQTAPPDSTNFYYTTGAGQTSLMVAIEY